MSAVYIKVTNDKYELPIAVADTPAELAEMCNTTKQTVLSNIYQYSIGKIKNTRYWKVEIDDVQQE